MITPTFLERCARAAHEVNRTYCAQLGDHSQLPWEEAPQWQRESAMTGVRGVIDGNGPEQSHESWLAQKDREGWRWGAVKDPDRLEHPCFVPYERLPESQKQKDHLFVAVVRGMVALELEITGKDQ